MFPGEYVVVGYSLLNVITATCNENPVDYRMDT